MDINIIITEQSHSSVAQRASKGANPLSPGEVSETTLAELLQWLRTKDNTTIVTSGGDIVISHFNQVRIEVLRTTITCDARDRKEVIKALIKLMAVSA